MPSNYLYLLPFKDAPHFKFGISITDDYARIIQLCSIYQVNFDKSLIVNSKDDSLIRMLERQIKVEYKNYAVADYAGFDGATEILNIDCFKQVLEEINHKIARGLDLKIETGIKNKGDNKKVGDSNSKGLKVYKKRAKKDFIANMDEFFIFYQKLRRRLNDIDKINVINNNLYLRCSRECYKYITEFIRFNRWGDIRSCSFSFLFETSRASGGIHIVELNPIGKHEDINDWVIEFSRVLNNIKDPESELYNSNAAYDFIDYTYSIFNLVETHPNYDVNYNPISKND
jgi:hypothetical protein